MKETDWIDFSFYPAKPAMLFDEDKTEITLRQGGGEFVLKRTSSEN